MLRMTREEYLKLLRCSGVRSSPPRPDIDKHASAPKPPKYRNHRVYVYQDGLVCQEKLEGHGGIVLRFDSVKEYDRWNDLLLLKRAGSISNLQRQVPLIVQEEFRDSNGKRQRSIVYRADFTYTEKGQDIVEDVKAFAKDRGKFLTTEAFNIKWKLLQRLYPQKTFRIF